MAKHAYPRAHIRAHGKHHRPKDSGAVARSIVVASGLTGSALVAGAALAPAAQAASAEDFARLRGCESGGNYSINTGNGFYGAYQFDLGTWHGLGYSGRPSDAAPSTQDAAARQLQAQRGWSPWPACSRKLGLGSGHSSSSSVSAASAHHTVIVSVRHTSELMSSDDAGIYRKDVRRLQADLHILGYQLAADGHFGAETDGVVRDFQKASNLTPDGVAGKKTLRAVHDAKVALQKTLTTHMRAI